MTIFGWTKVQVLLARLNLKRYLGYFLFLSFAVYIVFKSVDTQVNLDECALALTDAEIKTIVEAEANKWPIYKSQITNGGAGFNAEDYEWAILEQQPKSRGEADSEYDMAKYEVSATSQYGSVWALIGECGDLIVIGPLGD